MKSPFPNPALELPDAFATALLADRAALWRTVARGLSHELANASQMLTLDPPGGAAITEARDRVTRSAHVLAAFGRNEATTPPPCLASDVVVAVDQLQALQTGFPGISFELALERSLPALAVSSTDLEHVLLSLVTNAKQSGARRIALRVHAESGGVALRVVDDGAGVPPEWTVRLFEPGATTREGAHLGLGLVISRALMERWGGALAWQPSVRGACFVAHAPAFR